MLASKCAHLGRRRDQQVQFRRRVPRQAVGWDGVCQIEGEFTARCRIIDISMLGVGITLDHPSPQSLVGRHISVQVPAAGDSASIQLEGRITSAKLTLRTTVRVGVEFDSPSEELVKKVGGHAKSRGRRVRVR
jgi:PilZ domain